MPTRAGQPAHVAGLDFVSFYTAGTAVREERTGDLYNLNATRKFQASLQERDGLAIGTLYAPWWNPPFYALLFVPLSALSFHQALAVWLSVNVLCTAGAVWMLCRMLPPGTDWRTWALVPVLVVLSMPFMATLTHGQNSGTSLLLLTATVYFWRRNRALPAGLVCGLLFYKPQLALVLSGVMVVDLGLAAGVGVAVTGALLLAVNLIVLPGTLTAFLHQVPANLHFVQDQSVYPWARHVTPKAMFRVLIQGETIGKTSAVVAALAYLTTAIFTVLLSRLAFKTREQRFHRDRLIAATILATPVIMPFYFDYDLLLLAVPAVLSAVAVLGTRISRDAGSQPEDEGDGRPGSDRCWKAMTPAQATSPTLKLAARPERRPPDHNASAIRVGFSTENPASVEWPHCPRAGSPCHTGGALIFSLLYLVLLFNPDLTGALRINLASILLMALSAAVMFRTNLPEIAVEAGISGRLAA